MFALQFKDMKLERKALLAHWMVFRPLFPFAQWQEWRVYGIPIQ